MNPQAKRLRALIIKELYQIIRDPSSILISVVLPAILMFLFGYGVSLDLNHLKIGVVMEDHSPDAQRFVDSMTNSRFFDVKIVRDRRELDHDILSGAIRGFVVIPSYFSKFRENPSDIAPIQIIADGSEPNTANFVKNYVTGAWDKWLRIERITDKLSGLPPIIVQQRYWYNEELMSHNFLVPGLLAVIMTLVGTLLTALVVAREWERGTMESIMSTPVSINEIIVGKLIPYYFLGLFSLVVCVLMATLLYDVPFRGSFLLLLVVSSVFLFAALGLGLLISTLAKNQFVAAQAAIVSAFLPSYMLSGFIFEIASMPLIIQGITYLLPARYYVTDLLSLFLVGNVTELIVRNTIPILILGLLAYAVTSKFLVKRLD